MEPASQPPAGPQRLVSLDAYRGFVMLLMVGEVLHFCRVSEARPESGFWRLLCKHQSHVEWVGCTLHDLIQPSFSFIVGVALPFSIASRLAKGQVMGRVALHAFWRSFLLVALGIFLRSLGHAQTRFTFEDTLTQIGLGYGFLFLLGLQPLRVQWLMLGIILAGYWALFAVYPAPGTGFDYSTVGVENDWPHLLGGFAAHWQKNTNTAAAFDRWFLNLFPQKEPFLYNGGGYQTLSFIPTLGTMILGLLAGGVLQRGGSAFARFTSLVAAGLIGLGAGYGLHYLGVCPVVKRIWTPSWVLYSGGWCFLFLAGFHGIIDILGQRRWAFPLVVIGVNSIAIYCMSWTMKGFVHDALKTHLGERVFEVFGRDYAPVVSGGAVVLVFWLILFWMYRRRIFLRI